MNVPRHPPHDDDMLTVPTKATAAAWYDSAGKIVALLAGLVILISAGWVVFQMPGGGIRFGNQVETEVLAAATKANNDALAGKIDALGKRIDGVDVTLKEMNKNLAQVPLMSQILSDHTEHLHSIDGRLDEIAKQLGEDENRSAALVPGWYGSYAPQIRQPPRRQ